MLVDSGDRTDFGSGALRDMGQGKGRTDLLPWSSVADLLETHYSENVVNFVKTMDEISRNNADEESIFILIDYFCSIQGWDLPTFCLEASKQYEEGAKKYSWRNWEKGMPVYIFIDSCGRHFLKLLRGDTDEPHDRAVAWNLISALWIIQNKPEWTNPEYTGVDIC